ncbi:MAG: hypothetical protein EA392_00645 [Cryomorphaceae bacterium]|nr:MAG: hypothetical protein EA392_00645 [Cryomorphaceae bacterium]
MKKLIRITGLLIVAGLVAVGTESCYKKKDTIAEVYVRNASGAPIPGARVRLFGESSLQDQQAGEIILDDTRFTDGDGRAVFDYSGYFKAGQAGFAVLSVEISKQLPPPDEDLFLKTIMKIEPEVTNVEIYVLE